MSLPSVSAILQARGLTSTNLSPAQAEEVLVEAMRHDLKPALKLLHEKAHEAVSNGGRASWLEDPNSPLGKQLIRIHAGDVLRRLASAHFCHDARLTFANCCRGEVIVKDGEKPPKDEEDHALVIQIQTQAGPIAHADC